MIYSEVYSVLREYEFDIDKQKFIEWLNGKEPTKELLEEYIINKIIPREFPSFEDETFINAEIEDASEFIKSLNHDSK